MSNGIGKIIYRYWQNRLLVLAKSSTGIGKIIYRYWQNHLPVLAKTSIVLAKSSAGIDVIVYQGNKLALVSAHYLYTATTLKASPYLCIQQTGPVLH